MLKTEPKAIALGKNDKDYEKINEVLIQLVNDGTIEKLKEKYKVK